MKKLSKETRKILEFNWKLRQKLHAEGDKLYAKGDKLYAKGDKLWAETIIEFCGNIKLEWKFINDKQSDSCTLETGDVFLPL